MIQDYLQMFARDLNRFSESLLKKSILIEKPWTLIDEDGEHQTLIFKKDKSLILSKNGQAKIGSWDYLPDAKSLLIDRVTDKILCTEAYIDYAVLLLKLKGTKNQYFTLANENLIPDLDVLKYLTNLRDIKNKLFLIQLENGKTFKIIDRANVLFSLSAGSRVAYGVKNEDVEDGLYKIKTIYNAHIKIVNSKIDNIFYENVYKRNNDKDVLVLHKDYNFNFKNGDLVLYNENNDFFPDGQYLIHKNLIIETCKGKIIKKFKRFCFLWFCFGDFKEF